MFVPELPIGSTILESHSLEPSRFFTVLCGSGRSGLQNNQKRTSVDTRGRILGVEVGNEALDLRVREREVVDAQARGRRQQHAPRHPRGVVRVGGVVRPTLVRRA